MASLSSYIPQHWTSSNVQHVAAIMNKVFRDLLLCESSLIHLLPVPVVAAIIEVLGTEPDSRQSSWWWGRAQCQLVRKRAVELCGKDAGKATLAKVRATFVLLVSVIRHASLLSSCALDDSLYPNQQKGARERVYLSSEEVSKLITMLKAVGLTDVAEELDLDFKFQQNVVRINIEGEQGIAEYCHFSEEEQRVIVTCATSIIVRLSKLVKAMAMVARRVTSNIQFMSLVRKTTDNSKHVAIPFVLSQLFSCEAELVYSADAVQKLGSDILNNISERGPGIAGFGKNTAVDETPTCPARHLKAIDNRDALEVSILERSVHNSGSRDSGRDMNLQNEESPSKTIPLPVPPQYHTPQQNRIVPQKASDGSVKTSKRTMRAAARAAIRASTFVDYSDSVPSEDDPGRNTMHAKRKGQGQNSRTTSDISYIEESELNESTAPDVDQVDDQGAMKLVANDMGGEASAKAPKVQLRSSMQRKQKVGNANRKVPSHKVPMHYGDSASCASLEGGYKNRPPSLQQQDTGQKEPTQLKTHRRGGKYLPEEKASQVAVAFSMQIGEQRESQAGLLSPECPPQDETLRDLNLNRVAKPGKSDGSTSSTDPDRRMVSGPEIEAGELQAKDDAVRISSGHDLQLSASPPDYGSSERGTSQHNNQSNTTKINMSEHGQDGLGAIVENPHDGSDPGSLEDIVFQFTSLESQILDVSVSPNSEVLIPRKRGRKTNVPRRRRVSSDLEMTLRDPSATHNARVSSLKKAKTSDIEAASSSLKEQQSRSDNSIHERKGLEQEPGKVEEANNGAGDPDNHGDLLHAKETNSLGAKTPTSAHGQRSRSGKLIRKRKKLEPELSEVGESEDEDKRRGNYKKPKHNLRKLHIHPNLSMESRYKIDYRPLRNKKARKVRGRNRTLAHPRGGRSKRAI